MKNKLVILLILLTGLWSAGCTHMENLVSIKSQDVVGTDVHTNHISHYYDTEKDTAIPYEELQKRYEKHISQAWDAKLKGSLTDVLQHFEKAIQVNDSIQKYAQTEIIYIKNNQQTRNEDSWWKYILLTIGGMLLMLALRIYFYWKKRQEEHEPLIKLKDKEENARISQQQYDFATFKESELYREILQASQDDNINFSPITHPLKWISIQENLDTLFPDFTKKLLVQCPNLSETEQQICWLSKLGIPPSGIARILKLSRQAITNARTRIIKKMPQKEGQSTNFAHFIESL